MSKKIFAGELWLIKPSVQGQRWLGEGDNSYKIICGEKVKVMGITMDGKFDVEDFGTGDAYELDEEYFEKMVGKFDMGLGDDEDGAF